VHLIRRLTPIWAQHRARPSRENAWVVNALAISRFVARAPASLNSIGVIAMLDFVMIAIGVVFFTASILYVLACERM
jgi:hypothetical protein